MQPVIRQMASMRHKAYRTKFPILIWLVGLLFCALPQCDASASEMAGDTAVREGRYPIALQEYQAALGQDADAVHLLRIARKMAEFDLYMTSQNAPHPQLAVAVKLDHALKQPFDPESLRLLVLRFRLAFAAGDKQKAALFEAELRRVAQNAQTPIAEKEVILATLAFYAPQSASPDEQLRAYELIAEAQERRAGRDNPDVLLTLSRLAWKLADSKKFDAAITLTEEVYRRRKEILGARHFDTVMSRLALVEMRDLQGQLELAYPEAAKVADEVLELFGTHSDSTVGALSVALRVAQLKKRDADAARFGETGYKISSDLYGEGHATTQFFAPFYANALLQRGATAEAVRVYERGLDIATNQFQQLKDPAQVDGIIWLYLNYQKLQREADARRMMDLCAANVRQLLGDSDSRSFECLLRQGEAYLKVNDLARAERSLNVALELARKMTPPNPRAELDVLINLGSISAMRGEIGSALVQFELVADRMVNLPASELPWEIPFNDLLKNMSSMVCLQEGVECGRTRLLEQRVSKLFDGVAPMKVADSDLGESLQAMNSGFAAMAAGHHREALGKFKRSLVLMEKSPARGGFEQVMLSAYLNYLAAMLSADSQPEEALAYGHRAVETIERVRGQSGLSASQRIQFFSLYSQLYRGLAVAAAHGKDFEEAFRLLEHGKARVMAERVAQSGAIEQQLLAPAAATELKNAQAEVMRREGAVQQAVASRNERELGLASAELTKAQRVLEALRQQLSVQSPRYGLMSSPPVATVAALRKSLRPGELWISYFVLKSDVLTAKPGLADAAGSRKSKLAAFTVDAEQGVQFHDLGAVDDLDALVRGYRIRLSQPGEKAGNFTEDIARGLSVTRNGAPPLEMRSDMAVYLGKLLFKPLGKQLTRAKRVIISPDGPLAQLPFETLPLHDAALISSHYVSQAPSAAIWLMQSERANKRATSERTSLIAFGGARYNDLETRIGVAGESTQVSARWSDLPFTAAEVRRIADIFPGAATYIGANASEQTLDNLNRNGTLKKLQILHLAAHGYYDAQDPMRSGVVLDLQGASSRYPGVISAAKLLGYQLDTDLVVLSACETGLGRLEMGEGVMGLAWSLFVAGNRDLIVSLWPVSDQGTAYFMERLYRQLAAGKLPAEALGIAKREMIASGRWSDPYYWAPFVLHGY